MNDPTPEARDLREAAEFATGVLAQLYAKYGTKIGPFSSQAQKANVMLGAALRGKPSSWRLDFERAEQQLEDIKFALGLSISTPHKEVLAKIKARESSPEPRERLSVAETQALLGSDAPVHVGTSPTDPLGLVSLPQAQQAGISADVRAALEDYNGLLRTFHSVAGRSGMSTNWDGLQPRIRDVLDKHHATWLKYVVEQVPVAQPETKAGDV